MSCVEEIEEIPSSSSNEVLAAATREAAFLTDREREIILGVLTKDEQLRRQQQIKIMHLKAELQNLRRKGALKVSTDWDSTGPDPDRSCGRCRVELGRVINRGAYCRTCRLKVCKGCREYNFRATDWICTVCYKRMEIQAASGEWMNEFVRRPSRRRDTRVYVPAADIIKRTIRRSWTISNPTPRWTSLRNSPELRPYNSLPRGQDINNYPTLALHQQNLRSTDTTVDAVKKSPTRRAKSEDVYVERNVHPSGISDSIESVTPRNTQNDPLNSEQTPKRLTRVNPLMSVSLRESKENRERRKSPRRKTESVSESVENTSQSVQIEKDNTIAALPQNPESQKQEDNREKHAERHVSFDNAKTSDLVYFRSRSLSQSKSAKEIKKIPFSTRSLPEEGYMNDDTSENTENTIVELCDIEPVSGTVFRKMTVRRRRQENMRKMPAVDSGWRRPPDTDLFDILLPDGEDYRLVFVNSDSSSKEEDVDDNDSSSASSFPIDDCDWDYFEPGVTRPQQVLSWGSPFGSPRVYRKRLIDSPLGSPLLQRRPRIRESSDEDTGVPSPSETPAHPRTSPRTIVEPAEAMHCVHQSTIGQQTDPTRYLVTCTSCGGCASTPAAQYIPVPVPIPIPFPVPWGSALPDTATSNLIPLYKSLPNLPRASTHAQASDFWQFFAQVPGFPWGAIFEKPMIDEKVAERNENNGDVGNGGKEERNNRGEEDEEEEEEEPRGHLDCENRGSSASESSSTDSSEEEGEEGDQPRVRRVYNVTGPPTNRESDDALPSSNVTTDNEDEVDHRSSADEKEREEEEETSSGSADTDSNDTGTVADQKPKRFSRVFVVNHKGSSSSSSASVTSSSGATDSSDNDTDTELDCTVILTNIKQIDFEDDSAKDDETNAVDEEGDESGKANFLSMRYIGEDNDDKNCDKFSEEAGKCLASTSSERSQNSETAKEGNNRKIRGRGRKGNGKNRRRQKDDNNTVENNVFAENSSKNGCDKVCGGEQEEIVESMEIEDTWEDERESLNKEKYKKVPKNDKFYAKDTKEGNQAKANRNFENELEAIAKFISTEADHSTLLQIIKCTANDKNKEGVRNNPCLSNAEQIDCDKNDSDTIEEEEMILDNESIKVNKDELIEKGNEETAEKFFCKTDKTDIKSCKDDIEDPVSKERTSCNLSSLLHQTDQVTDRIDTVPVNLETIEENEAEVLDNDSMQNENNDADNDTNQDEFICLKIGDSTTRATEGDKPASTDAAREEVNDIVDEPCETTSLSLSSVLKSGVKEGSDNECLAVLENNVKGSASGTTGGIEVIVASTSNAGLSNNGLTSNVGDVSETEASEPIVIGKAVMRDEETKKKSAYETYVDDLQSKYRTDYTYSSSPGLSDVSAESLSSSDVEKESSRSRKELEWGSTKTDVSGGKSATKTKHQFVSRDRDDARRDAISKRETEELPGACSSDHTGVLPSVNGERSQVNSRNAAGAKYTSLVMITNDLNDATYQQVSVVTSDTTKIVPGENPVVVVSHTNRQNEPPMDKGREHNENSPQSYTESNVTVITSAETLSAFEEGLADDDSWVENLSYEDDDDNDDDDDDDDFPTNSISENSSSGDEVTLTCSAAIDQEDELRGYHRAAIDFTLHTIVEESCEESEVEQAPLRAKKERPPSATDLEKYFFFGLGDGTIPSINSNREDAYSETSSIYSEGMESLGGAEDSQNDCPEELASSRLEKYFLSGFMGFTAERRDSDGSVGSDSEGKPSPEQRRKRLVRARGTGRSHSNSLDNLLGNPDLAGSEQHLEAQNNSENSSSSDSDAYDDILGFEKSDGQFDTVKRKKTKKQKASLEDIKNLGTTPEEQEGKDSDEEDDRNKTPQPEVLSMPSNLTTNRNQQSRDSGFVGSCDDLLKDQRDINKSPDIMLHYEKISENVLEEKREEVLLTESFPPATNLTRKDSFNNWSSDEETNLMMSKMRQFFKTMVANTSSSKPTTPNLSARTSPKPFPRAKTRCKPPQLVYFENELTRLMKTVPGIRDDQVREIVEYLSSEDTWSDSYDSSDYTSSDLEGASTKSALQQQISDSCKQIINKFDVSAGDEEGDAGDGGIIDESHGINKETAFVYQKLVASFEKMATEDHPASTSGPNSPPLIAKVMHHIGSRLVALMHEVSSGESHASNSPKARNYHRRLQQKLSNASTTTTDDDSTSDTNLPDTFVEGSLTNYHYMLPRSKSHDLLMGDGNKNLNQSISGVSEISEEREASDCERFSWRGSFESALLATDSRNRLSLIGGEGSASASALAIAAKRRSAGDLLFSHKSLSREQLDRVRSCGSIGGGSSEDKLWVATATKSNRRRSSVPDAASCGSGASADGEDEDEEMENRATLPRSMQSGPQTTNSLPRLPTTSVGAMQKAHFLPQNVKSARYRPPGFSRLMPTQPKRAVSAPGLQPSHQRRGRRSQQSNVPSDDVSLSEAHSSPMLASRTSSKSATPSPVAPASRRKTASVSSQEWPTNDDDIDRLVAMHHNRSSLSSLGLRSDSMASVYSGAGEGRYGTVTVRGQVEFGLQYNYKAGALEIQIKQCKDLAPVDVKRNRSDPYVKVYLLPDKSKSGKRKTKVKKHTLNPVFDECLKFHMSLNELEIRTLWLSVWHSDMFGRNDFLGEVMMTLENKVFDDPTPKWYNLQERTEPFDDILSFKGDIIVCLKFVPPDMTVHKKGKRSRGALHVLVKEAKGLTAVKAHGSSDPFCKSYLLPDKGRSSKQKTPVVKRTVNPVWNYTFIYDDVTLQELAERSLELTVWDHDRLASNEFLGMVRFSLGTGKHYGKSVEWMDSTGKELGLWKSMLERPNFWVEGCLALRSTLMSPRLA